MTNIFGVSAFTEKVTNNNKSGKKYPFVVLNDATNGYAKLLFGLFQVEVIENELVNKRGTPHISQAKEGDVIVFGDGRNYDYRILKDPKEVFSLDERKYCHTKNIFSIMEFEKLIGFVHKYSKANTATVSYEDDDIRFDCICIEEPIKRRKPKRKPKKSKKEKPILIHVLGGIVAEGVVVLLEEKNVDSVHIFRNWVKIGYDQYDIYVDLFGNEFIIVDGTKLFINEDYRGRKYLDFEIR